MIILLTSCYISYLSDPVLFPGIDFHASNDTLVITRILVYALHGCEND